MVNIVLVLGVHVFLLFIISEASDGDYHPVFRQCNLNCVRELSCPYESYAFKWIYEPCFSCRQNCIWKTVDSSIDSGEGVPQFFGKWPFASYSLPFASIVPMQEPAAVLFSVLNFLTASRLYVGASRLPRAVFMRNVWRAYAVVGMTAFFHWSDFWLTEYLDYFSAFAVIMFAFFTSISLVVSSFPRIRVLKLCWRLLFVGLFCIYVRHIWRLTIHFDYGYNMLCCLCYSILTVIIYTLWIASQWNTRSNSKASRQSLKYLGAAILCGLGSSFFEVFDFPPIFWVLDAHALFHLGTVPIPLFLHRFIRLENEVDLHGFNLDIKAS